jgi:hypothetical protein
MKKIVLALAGVAAVVAPVAFTATTAGAAADNSTVNCKDNGDNNHCSVTDPDGINYIRVIDAETGQLVKTVDLNCADNVTQKGFSFPDNGERYRVIVRDCQGNTDTHKVVIPEQP